MAQRCRLTGRQSATRVRTRGFARVTLRRLAHAGYLPGLRKSSW
jgi:ribosomal protein S14